MQLSYPRWSAYARARAKPVRTRVLVIAPHPDDDVIGCGGALRRLAARGARISVLYVTDGSASHVKSKRFPPAVLRDLREAEARDALQILGVRVRPRFLRAPDGRLAQLDAAESAVFVAAIARRIERFRPHVLFVPWRRDPHPDHIATAALVERAQVRCRRPVTYFYGVWLAVRGTADDAPQAGEITLREIALAPAEVEAKRVAILQHRSQSSALIDDDPEGFRIDAALLAQWLEPVERFYRRDRALSG